MALRVIVGLPECAVCGRPVERLHEWHDLYTEEFVFVAVCHGDREMVRLQSELIESMPRFRASMGKAFASKALPQKPKELSE